MVWKGFSKFPTWPKLLGKRQEIDKKLRHTFPKFFIYLNFTEHMYVSHAVIDCEDLELSSYKPCPDGSPMLGGIGLTSGSISSNLRLKKLKMSLALNFLVYYSNYLYGVVVELNKFVYRSEHCLAHRKHLINVNYYFLKSKYYTSYFICIMLEFSNMDFKIK